jgi:hypothetical protein
MFEIGLLIAMFVVSVFIGAGLYVGGLTAEWAVAQLKNLKKRHE